MVSNVSGIDRADDPILKALLLNEGAGMGCCNLAGPEDHQSRHGADTILGCDLRVLVNVKFDDLDLAKKSTTTGSADFRTSSSNVLSETACVIVGLLLRTPLSGIGFAL